MNFRRLSCILLSAVLPVALISAPEDSKQDEERFVRLMSAQSVRILEKDGRTYRQAEGPARFLHNNTWLICDTALWDVDRQLIHAFGHVSLEQDRTELKSDSLNYFIERNTAEFRGSLVQLQDKDGNILRTKNLDYNTKDSVAVFRGGAAMRDKDGQIMESLYGTYDSKIKLFEFQDKVNMYTDSVFVKTSTLKYDSNTSIATFPGFLDAWKDENMLSGRSGWWDRSKELFFFKGNVHATTDTQESWSDSLYFDRSRMNVDMLGNVQVTDTTRAVTALAGRIYYCDTLSRVEMFRNPVVLLEANEKDDDGIEKKDTVFCRADSIAYWTVPRNRVDSSSNAAAQARQKEISSDPVANIRAKAAEEEAKRRQEAIDNDPNADPTLKTEYKEKMRKEEEAAKASADSLKRAMEQERQALDRFLKPVEKADTLAAPDSLQAITDTLAVNDSLSVGLPEPDDSIKIGFLKAHGKVKVFRNTLQVSCDSLLYNDIDSLARLFKDPMVWNDVKHQYNADSIYLAVHSSTVDKAYLLSNAFIHIDEEERDFFDQIKSTEMTAFFDGDGKLKRFDAMGGASAIFFMREKERVSTANKKEAKILTAEFENNEIRKISYFEEPKSDVYPVAQMSGEDKFLKGYRWNPDARPKSPSELTDRVPRKSQRSIYASRPRATFTQTERFFRGYMAKIYREIERSDSLRRVKNTAPAVGDTLATTDTMVMAVAGDGAVTAVQQISAEQPLDSIIAGFKVDLQDLDSPIIMVSCPQIDSLIEQGRIKKARADSIAAIKTPAQLKKEAAVAAAAKRKADAKARQEARIAAREARWAELDLRDSLKLAARNARKHDNKDKKLQRKIKALLEQKAKEDALLEKYKQGYLKRFRRDGLPKDAIKETDPAIVPGQTPQRREVHREDSSEG